MEIYITTAKGKAPEGERILGLNLFTLPNLEAFLDVIIAIIPIILILFPRLEGLIDIEKVANPEYVVLRVFLVLFSISIIYLKIRCFIMRKVTKRQFEASRQAEELTKTTLAAFKKANAAKSRYILQSTYGSVPEWHPTNYVKNVLVYDVHEQLRSILVGLQEQIIEATPGFHEDNVAVDLVYCYPSTSCKGFDGTLPARNCKLSQNSINDGWRLITGSSNSYSGSVHKFLEAENSFFGYVDRYGYAFFNDKNECKNDYIISTKDVQYDSRGSVVGIKIVVKNDEPEQMFVKAILTITTYGRRLYEKGDKSTLQDYESVFKEHVLNSYLCLLTSELAQMYIRHAIKSGDMCRFTGRACSNKSNGCKNLTCELQNVQSCPQNSNAAQKTDDSQTTDKPKLVCCSSTLSTGTPQDFFEQLQNCPCKCTECCSGKTIDNNT